MSDSIPTTRDTFKQFCLNELGEPVIQINVAPEQIEQQIDKALSKFYGRHYDATEEKHIVHIISAQDASQGYISLSNKIMGVKNVTYITESGAGSIWSATYQIYLEDYVNQNGVYSPSGLQDFYITKQHLALINYYLSPEIRFNWNKLTKRLIIEGKNLSDWATNETPVLINVYERITDSNGQDSTAWTDNWLQRYATSLIKKQWGSNLKKFQNIQLVGGVTLDGKTIYDEAVEEIKELEEELEKSYEEPLDFFVG